MSWYLSGYMGKTALQQFLRGVKHETPLLIGVVPFGAIYGVLALSAGLQAIDAQAMSSIIFAGSAQFMTVQLIREATPWMVIILTGFVINLRHVLYSASLAPYLHHLSLRWKVLLSYLMTDEAFVVAIINYQHEGVTPNGHWYYLGAGLALWSTWQISTAAGIFLGALVPESWGLDFALPLTFIALVVPTLKDKAGLITAVVAGLGALLFFGLPYNLGLIVASGIAIGVGIKMEASE